MICPFRGADAKSGKIVQEIPRTWHNQKKQRVVIEILLPEAETAQNISRRLKQVYGECAINHSTVTRWVKQINDGQEEPAESDLCDKPRNGRPSSAYSSANIDQEDTLIRKNRRITINELAESLGVSKRSAVKIMNTWGIQKCVQGWSQSSSQRLINNPA